MSLSAYTYFILLLITMSRYTTLLKNLFGTFIVNRNFFDLYHVTGLFLYRLKTSENPWFADIF